MEPSPAGVIAPGSAQVGGVWTLMTKCRFDEVEPELGRLHRRIDNTERQLGRQRSRGLVQQGQRLRQILLCLPDVPFQLFLLRADDKHLSFDTETVDDLPKVVW